MKTHTEVFFRYLFPHVALADVPPPKPDEGTVPLANAGRAQERAAAAGAGGAASGSGASGSGRKAARTGKPGEARLSRRGRAECACRSSSCTFAVDETLADLPLMAPRPADAAKERSGERRRRRGAAVGAPRGASKGGAHRERHVSIGQELRGLFAPLSQPSALLQPASPHPAPSFSARRDSGNAVTAWAKTQPTSAFMMPRLLVRCSCAVNPCRRLRPVPPSRRGDTAPSPSGDPRPGRGPQRPRRALLPLRGRALLRAPGAGRPGAAIPRGGPDALPAFPPGRGEQRAPAEVQAVAARDAPRGRARRRAVHTPPYSKRGASSASLRL